MSMMFISGNMRYDYDHRVWRRAEFDEAVDGTLHPLGRD
jgi:hypothetical protein